MKPTIWFAAFVCAANTFGMGAAIVSIPANVAQPDSFGTFSMLAIFSFNFAAALLLGAAAVKGQP